MKLRDFLKRKRRTMSHKAGQHDKIDRAIPLLVTLGVPLNAIQDTIPATADFLPLTGTNTGQFGLLLAIGYLWMEWKRLR